MGLFDEPALTRVHFEDEAWADLRPPTLGELQDAREVAAKKRQKNLSTLPAAAVTAIFAKDKDDDEDPDVAQDKADRVARRADIPSLVVKCLVAWSDEKAVSGKAIRDLPAHIGLALEKALAEIVQALTADKAPIEDFPSSTED